MDGAEAKAAERTIALPVGVVVRRAPGVTRWARWSWRAVAVLPGAGPADWAEMRREGDAVEYHAGTIDLTLHRADTEAYRVALANRPPCVYVVLRPDPGGARDYALHAVTASPFEAQDFADNAEDVVEPVPAPAALVAWIEAFAERHHVEEPFVKRRRDKLRTDRVEDGKGDPRVRQTADVYRAPGARRGG